MLQLVFSIVTFGDVECLIYTLYTPKVVVIPHTALGPFYLNEPIYNVRRFVRLPISPFLYLCDETFGG